MMSDISKEVRSNIAVAEPIVNANINYCVRLIEKTLLAVTDIYKGRSKTRQ